MKPIRRVAIGLSLAVAVWAVGLSTSLAASPAPAKPIVTTATIPIPADDCHAIRQGIKASLDQDASGALHAQLKKAKKLDVATQLAALANDDQAAAPLCVAKITATKKLKVRHGHGGVVYADDCVASWDWQGDVNILNLTDAFMAYGVCTVGEAEDSIHMTWGPSCWVDTFPAYGGGVDSCQEHGRDTAGDRGWMNYYMFPYIAPWWHIHKIFECYTVGECYSYNA